MTQVKIEKEYLAQLVDFKLNHLRKKIEKILKKWGYTSSNKFFNTSNNNVFILIYLCNF